MDHLCAPVEEACAGYVRPLFAPLLDGNYDLPGGLGRLSVFTRSGKHRLKEQKPMLFVDAIWPAAYCISDYLVRNPSLVRGKNVIELGAGAALPSCVAAKLGAECVLITDYPATDVIENISDVIAANGIANASASSYVWGDDVAPLMDRLKESDNKGFDLILMADLFWKDTYHLHRNLLDAIKKLQAPLPITSSSSLLSSSQSTPLCLIAFAHRPTELHTPSKDLEFFKVASEEYNYHCQLIEVCDKYGDDTDNDSDSVEVFLYAIFAHS